MKKSTKSDARRQAFADLSRKIAAMDDIQRAQLAATMPIVTVAGHALSVHNACLIAMQCHSATVVGGFKQWIAAGRCVRKGEHGMMILVPASKKDPETGEAGKTFFVPSYVFDVSQTEELKVDSSRENPDYVAPTPKNPDAPSKERLAAMLAERAAAVTAPDLGGYYSDEFTPL